MADDFTPDSDDFEPDTAPTLKPGRVPSPTGWRDPRESAGLKGFAPPARDWERLDAKKLERMLAALSSGAHGAANAMEGPVNGALEASKHLGASPDDLLNIYRTERDRVESEQAPNLRDFPHAPVVGAVLAGGVGQAPTAPRRIAIGIGQGGVYGFGSSKGDVLRDPATVAGDTGLGMAIGGAGAAVGEGLNAVAGRVANKLGGVLDKNTANAQALADKAMRSARGTLGAEVSSGSRTLEVLEGAVNNPNVDPSLRQAAAEFLAGPEGAALKNQVIRSSLGRAADNTGRIQNTRDALVAAIEGQAPEAVETAATARLNDSSPLARRLRELLPKVVLPAIGGALAGPEGAAAGGLTAAVLGRSGTTVRNLLADPYVSSRALGLGAAGLRGAGAAVPPSAMPVVESGGKTPTTLLQPYLDLLRDDENNR